ncbi:MAG: hypothetical protein ABIM83_07570 [candidate division WOR-3 bacterium]
MNWLILFFLNFYFEKEFTPGAPDFYNYYSLDYSLKWDYFKDGIYFLIPLRNGFELLLNNAHITRSLFVSNKITYPDSQIITSVYAERDKYESTLNGFSFQTPIFKKFSNFKTGYDIYTSRAYHSQIVQHHYFVQLYRKDFIDLLYYHSDFDFPLYYFGNPQKEKYEDYNLNYYFKNLKFSIDYQYLGNFLNHQSISQLKSEITLTFTYKLLNINIILKDKILKFVKNKEKNRFGFFTSLDFKKLIYFTLDYENDKNLSNHFSFESILNIPFKNMLFLPFYSIGLYFPNPVIESRIFSLYSTPFIKRERRNIFGFNFYDKEFKNLSFSYEYAYVKDMPIFKNGMYNFINEKLHSFQFNLFKEFNKILIFEKIFFKPSIIYITLSDFYPNMNSKITVGSEKIVRENVKILFEYSLFLTEKTNMSSGELKANFFDVLFITLRINNIFNQKFYLIEGFNFYEPHLTIFVSANIWH